MKKLIINPNKIKTRDLLMLRLIQGATKSAVHKDRKKELNKHACRKNTKHGY